jgi:subtilisin family serine protease
LIKSKGLMRAFSVVVGGLVLLLQQSKGGQLPKTDAQPETPNKLESPVKIDPAILIAHGSTYDPKSVSDDWFAKKIYADRVPGDEIDKGAVTIAILDSGIDATNPAFAKNLWEHHGLFDSSFKMTTRKIGWDFVNNTDSPLDDLQNSHGTHVAGLASARWLGTQYSAFDPNKLDSHIILLICKIADKQERVSSVEGAIAFAARSGARVVSGSWTLTSDTGVDSPLRTYDNVLFVVAAGNGADDKEGIEITKYHHIYPASFGPLPNLITVGATDPDDNVAYFSNWGKDYVDIFAPGVEIKSTVRGAFIKGEPYGRLSGTSQATPLVALTAALLLANYPGLGVHDVKNRILITSDFAGDTWRKGSGGRLNMAKALIADHDLLQLNDGTLLMGTIANKTIDFIDSQECDPKLNSKTKVRSLFVENEGVVRIAMRAYEGKSVVFANNSDPYLGTVCEQEITFTNLDGTTIHKNPAELQDLVWALYKK